MIKLVINAAHIPKPWTPGTIPKRCEPNQVKEHDHAVDAVSLTRLQLNQIASHVLLLKQTVSVVMEARP